MRITKKMVAEIRKEFGLKPKMWNNYEEKFNKHVELADKSYAMEIDGVTCYNFHFCFVGGGFNDVWCEPNLVAVIKKIGENFNHKPRIDTIRLLNLDGNIEMNRMANMMTM